MSKLLLAGAIAAAGLSPALPNPSYGRCFIVGNDTEMTDPSFAVPEQKVTEFHLIMICGERHPGTAPGQFVERDEFKLLTMDEAQAEIVRRAAEDWLDDGLPEPQRP